MRPLISVLFVALSFGALVPAASAAPKEPEGEVEWRGRSAFDVWKDEHRWVRLGMRFYALAPQEHENALLSTGAGLTIPVTTDFFMGLGMKVGFMGGWNAGECESWISDRSLDCRDTVQLGVDYTYKTPISDTGNGGADPTARQGTSLLPDQRRDTHVAHFALTIGANYEVTIPNLQFFRIFQPFFGGGAVIAWIYTFSDMREGDYVLINNPDNDTTNPDNIDPYSLTEAVVGGEVYGGFHLNMDKAFRFTIEFGYYRIDVPSEPLVGATEGWDAVNLEYTLADGRFGGGFEFRF